MRARVNCGDGRVYGAAAVFAEVVHGSSIFEGVRKGILHRASGMLGVDDGARVDITPTCDSQRPTGMVFNLICAALRG